MADSKEVYDFKKQIAKLEKHRGRGTELISVYITPGYPISDISGKLRDEYGQAANIKSKSTQKNVQAAIEKVLAFLKTLHKPPENGVAIFAGNVSENEGKSDVQLFYVVPPTPLHVQFYRCESTFVIEPLKEMLEQEGSYGLVVMDGKEATIALLRGKDIKVVRKLTSTAHQKVHKGGQSAARFQRIHDEVVEVYYKRVGKAMDAFVDVKAFKGVIVGGPGPAKEDFMRLKPFNYKLQILGVVDTGYTDEYGLREVLDKSGDLIAEQEAVREKRLLDRFMKAVVTGGLATYGLDDIRSALTTKKIETILVSEGLDLKEFRLKCSACGKEAIKVQEKHPEYECGCGGKMIVQSDSDILSEVLTAAEAQNLPIEMVSQQTAEGAQFRATFRGLGAFLRYR
ncbi:TPA: peptide chain release factor 1 [Candidatus Micrarchaeota archaeon]|nr:MAG: peptide chain release factor 1 [Candidatus Micrarchaeota archaeon CG1_02_51_15]HII38620.1 peptide chain release factor 1 [Candidatus Micrarchaeota archaeon]